jgi:uncharacterized protein
VFIDFSDLLVKFHQHCAHSDSNTLYATYKEVTKQMSDNFSVLRSYSTDADVRYRVELLQNWSEDSLSLHSELIDWRHANGRIVEGHGDLHLANLVLINDSIVPFDCLEFSASLRWCDVASEVGFVVMDLIYHGSQGAANVFLNSYLEHSNDYQLLQLLRLFMVYRAMVRAKVDCLSDGSYVGGYIRVAEHIAFTRSAPQLIITHGFSGCGKTWLTDQLLERSEVIRIRSDVVRKNINSVSNEDSDASLEHKQLYTSNNRDKVYNELLQITEVILKSGFSVIVDATFLQHKHRHQFRILAQTTGCPFTLLDCTAPFDILKKRITQRQRLGKDASDADIAVLTKQCVDAEPLQSDERQHTYQYDSGRPINADELDALAKALGCASQFVS